MTMNLVSKTGCWTTTGLVFAVFSAGGCGWAEIANEQAIGRPCDLTVNAGPAQGVYNSSAAECPSGLCLKPVVQPGASSPGDTGPTCSGECNQDSDCQGETRDPSNNLDYRCTKGFACAIPFVKGSLACKKVCVCKDFLGPAGATTPIACQGTTGTPLPAPTLGVEQETDLYVSVAPVRQIDILAMVDNSPSMAPKIDKLNAGFPKLIEALRDPNDGSLPDLRVAIIDGDLGTDNAYGVGNSCGPKTLADGTVSPYGDLGRFQMRSSPTPCAFGPGALFLEAKSGLPLNYTGDISAVFSCLTSNLGTHGCDYGHQLQAFEFGLVAGGVGNEAQQAAFLRPAAQLGLIILSDEDDCSAATNEGMFGDKPELRGESASLRCATRAHMCGGVNLTTSPPGYPTTASYTHAFSDCQARTDACPNLLDGLSTDTDISLPTNCSPLRSIFQMAKEILGLKAAPEQVLAAGIFGWPRNTTDMASAEYKIAPIPNPNTADTAYPTVFASWPVCYDPNHLPSAATTDPATGFDATAAAWGATGGLRESAFIDEFGANGMKFSICEPDLSQAMQTIGNAFAGKRQNLCVNYKLLDTDLLTPGLQPDCRVVYRTPSILPSGDWVYMESPTSLPLCPPGATSGNVATDCWQLTSDVTQCPVASGQMVNVLRTSAEIAAGPLAPGTKIGMQCRTCADSALGSGVVAAGCDY